MGEVERLHCQYRVLKCGLLISMQYEDYIMPSDDWCALRIVYRVAAYSLGGRWRVGEVETS